MYSISSQEIEYNIGTFAQGDPVPEVNVNYPIGANQYVAFKFELERDTNDSSLRPIS